MSGEAIAAMLLFDFAAALEPAEQFRQGAPAPMPQTQRAGHFAYAFGAIRFREIREQVAFGDFRRAVFGLLAFVLHGFSGAVIDGFSGLRHFTPAIVCGARGFSRNFFPVPGFAFET